MDFIRKHWYDLGLIPLVAALIYQIINRSTTDLLQKLALFNFMVIFWHQFEEAMTAYGVTADNYPEKEKEWFAEYGRCGTGLRNAL